MDNSGLLKSAKKIVDELNELMIICTGDNYELSQIEVDLLKEKTRHTYDLLLKLKPLVSKDLTGFDDKDLTGLQSKDLTGLGDLLGLEKEKPDDNVEELDQNIHEPEIVVKELNQEISPEIQEELKENIEKPVSEIIEPEIIEKELNQEIPSEIQEEPEGLKENIEKPVSNIIEPEIVQEDLKDEISSEAVEEPIPENKKTEPTELFNEFDLFSEPSVGEKFEEKKTVVEQITEDNKVESLGDKIQQDKISDLKSAIGINEKFFFINELFDGDMKNYNETIDKLDIVTDLEGGLQLLKELKEGNNWKEENDAFEQLSGFVVRKFK